MKHFICLCLLILSINCFSQKQVKNALQFPDLVVNDLVPIDTNYFSGFGYSKAFNSQSINEVKFVDNFDLAAFFIKRMTESKTNIFRNYSPYKNVYFEKYNEVFEKIPRSEIKLNLGEYTDTVMQVADNGELENLVIYNSPDTSQIRALLFFDKWFFDEQNFQFSKKVLAYCPIRKYHRNYFEAEDEWSFKKIGFFVFPELKKRQLKKIHRRMKLFAHVKYEFSIENRELFGNTEGDLALFTEDLESPNWNSYARQKFRNLLINRVLTQKSKAYDYYTKEMFSLEKLKTNLGYEKSEIVTVDPETGDEKIIEVETEIIYEYFKSVIFIEDWYIDTESMLIEKQVVGIAPVRFYENYETGDIIKKIAFVLYFNKANQTLD